GEHHVIPYSRARIEQFSPNSAAVLEIRHRRDLEVLENVYTNSVLLGDESSEGWGVTYKTEFHMTGDSGLFQPLPSWERKGYRPDEYGRWLLGAWQARSAAGPAPLDAPRHE